MQGCVFICDHYCTLWEHIQSLTRPCNSHKHRDRLKPDGHLQRQRETDGRKQKKRIQVCKNKNQSYRYTQADGQIRQKPASEHWETRERKKYKREKELEAEQEQERKDGISEDLHTLETQARGSVGACIETSAPADPLLRDKPESNPYQPFCWQKNLSYTLLMVYIRALLNDIQ